MESQHFCLELVDWLTYDSTLKLGAIQETHIHFYSTPTSSFKGSLGVFLNQPIWHPSPISTLLQHVFPPAEINGRHLQNVGRLIKNYYFSVAHLIISLLLSNLSATTSQENNSHCHRECKFPSSASTNWNCTFWNPGKYFSPIRQINKPKQPATVS